MASVTPGDSGLKHIEESARASDERFLKAFHASPACQIIVSREDGRIFEVNDAFCDMVGYKREELVGRDSGEFDLRVDLGDRAAGMAESVQTGRLPDLEMRVKAKSGEYRDVMGHVEPLEWQGVPSVIAAVLDITEQKRVTAERAALQQQLFEVQKMETVGQLAGGIAHDFNNILMVQRGYCELMRLSLKEDDPLRKGLAQIESYIDKASALTSQLLAFSRKQPLHLEVFDLNYLVEDMELTLRRVAGENVHLTTELSAHPAMIEADRLQMQQVLVTLTASSRQALAEGGKLDIAIAQEDVDVSLEGVGGSIVPGSYVVLSVSDTGPGLDAETTRRIFEPFYRNADRKRDPGLGLSAVYGIIRQSGGNIAVRTELEGGVTFRIYLPRVEAWPAEPPKGERTGKTGGQLVLVVEDEPTLRELIVVMVKQLGCEVKDAGNGSQALALVEREHLIPDLLLTDVVMPEMGGVSLVEKLRADMPDLKVIYMSGYASDSSDDLGFGDPRTAFLRKPFSLVALEGQIKSLMGPIIYH
jgi:two-component system cell cycle sensor histidine kinase/response regulator CckA